MSKIIMEQEDRRIELDNSTHEDAQWTQTKNEFGGLLVTFLNGFVTYFIPAFIIGMIILIAIVWRVL